MILLIVLSACLCVLVWVCSYELTWHMAFVLFVRVPLQTVDLVYKAWIEKAEPFVNTILLGPGFICGAIWALAQISWFYANAKYDIVVEHR